MPQFRVGQQVRYKPIGGPDSKTSESTGIIREVITEPGNMTGRNVAASSEEPRYEIENTHTHKRSAIKEENIIERIH